MPGEYGTPNFGEGPYGGVGPVSADLSPTYNIIAHRSANLTPVYEILPGGVLTTVVAVLSPSYNVIARRSADLVATYRVGDIFTPLSLAFEVEEEFDPERLASFARRCWNFLAPIQLGSTDLNHYIGGIGELFQEVEDYAADTDEGAPGWSALVDVDRVPSKGLDWLAQFVGVKLDHDDSDSGLRQQVRGHDRWGRGTPLSIIGPASRWVPQDGRFYMSERNPNPWHVVFILVDKPQPTQFYEDIFEVQESYHKLRTAYSSYQNMYGSGRGDWDKVIDILQQTKPAGIQYSIINTSTTLYMAIYILEATYQAVYNDFLTYQALYVAPFPDINLDIPVFRQLVSTRYYRNIFYQFETFLDVYDSYVLY